MNATTDLSNQPAPIITHTCDVAQFRDSNDPNNDYRVSSNTFDLTAAGRDGRARVTAKVNGYWSTDVITLYVERANQWSSNDNEPAKWVCTMSHSSGGRLKELSDSYPAEYYNYTAVANDLDAEMNFGAALISLAQFGREILQHSDFMEETYQIQRAADRAERDAEEAAKAAIEADLPLGLPAAKKLVAEARAAVTPSQNVTIRCYPRGKDNFFTAACAKSQFITWTWSGQRLNEEAVIAKLAASSHRTTLA